jgi:hypothetical protein
MLFAKKNFSIPGKQRRALPFRRAWAGRTPRRFGRLTSFGFLGAHCYLVGAQEETGSAEQQYEPNAYYVSQRHDIVLFRRGKSVVNQLRVG